MDTEGSMGEIIKQLPAQVSGGETASGTNTQVPKTERVGRVKGGESLRQALYEKGASRTRQDRQAVNPVEWKNMTKEEQEATVVVLTKNQEADVDRNGLPASVSLRDSLRDKKRDKGFERIEGVVVDEGPVMDKGKTDTKKEDGEPEVIDAEFREIPEEKTEQGGRGDSKPDKEGGSEDVGRTGIEDRVKNLLLGLLTAEEVAEYLGKVRRMFATKGKNTADPDASLGEVRDILKEISEKLSTTTTDKLEGKAPYEVFTQRVAEQSRSFREIQNDIKMALNIRDPKEREQALLRLQTERDGLLVAADTIGLFDDVRVAMEREREMYFKNRANLLTSEEEERFQDERVKATDLENRAKGYGGYTDKFEGAVKAYAEAERESWAWAWDVANARGDYEGRQKERLDVLMLDKKFGQELVGEARMWFDRGREAKEEKKRQQEMEMARQVAEAARGRGGEAGTDQMSTEYGRMRQEQAKLMRQNFFQYERNGKKIFDPVPELGSDFYLGLTPEEAGMLEVRIYLSNGRARIQSTIKADQVFPNPELQALTKEMLGRVEDLPGVSEATALYTALILRPDKMQPYLEGMGLPNKGIVLSGDEPEIMAYRDKLAMFLQRRLGLDEEQAEVAERVGFNQMRAFWVPEDADSRFYPASAKKKRGRMFEISNLIHKNVAHPADSMMDGVTKLVTMRGGDVGYVTKESNQTWPRNKLGEAIIENMKRNRIFDAIQTAPLVRNALYELEFTDSGGSAYRMLEIDQGSGLYKGKMIDAAIDVVERGAITDENKLKWNNYDSERPLFTGYYFSKVRWAAKFAQIVESLSLPDMTVQDVVKMVEDLGITDYRTLEFLETICIATSTKNPMTIKNGRLELNAPGMTGSIYKSGLLSGFRKANPSFGRLKYGR